MIANQELNKKIYKIHGIAGIDDTVDGLGNPNQDYAGQIDQAMILVARLAEVTGVDGERAPVTMVSIWHADKQSVSYSAIVRGQVFVDVTLARAICRAYIWRHGGGMF